MTRKTIGGTLGQTATNARSSATMKMAAMQTGRSAMSASDMTRTRTHMTKTQTAPTVVTNASTAPTKTVNTAMSGKIITPQ